MEGKGDICPNFIRPGSDGGGKGDICPNFIRPTFLVKSTIVASEKVWLTCWSREQPYKLWG